MQPQTPYGPPQGDPYPPPGPAPANDGQPSPQQYAGPLQPQYPGQPSQPFHPAQPTPYNGLAQPADGSQAPQPQAGQYWQPGQQPYQAGPQQPAIPQYQPPAGFHHGQGPHAPPMPAPPPRHKTPYDFFMLQKHPVNTKFPMGTRKQASMASKLIWVVGGGLVLLLIIGMVNALTPKDTTNAELLAVAQTQQEIIRICSQGANKTKLQVNRNFAGTCTASITSDQRQLILYLGQQGVKIKSNMLDDLTDSKNDSELSAAVASSDYDNTFKSVSERILTNYNSRLQQQLASEKLGPNGRELITASSEHNKLLIQLVQTQSTDRTEAVSN